MVPPYSTALQVSPHGPSVALLLQLIKFECPKPKVWPNSCAITNDDSESCMITVPLLLFEPPNCALPDQIHPARGDNTTKYLFE